LDVKSTIGCIQFDYFLLENVISHGYVRCTLDHWSVMNSYKYKNCLQRRSFSISPEAMLRFHFQVHENLAKL